MLAELKGIKKSYGAFQLDVTMQLEEGRITGVVGKNGAGKSTTFKAMLGLIHTEGGTMRLLGQDGPIDSPKRKQQVGVVLSGSTFCGALTGKQVCGIMESLYDAFDRNWFQEQCRRLAIPLDRKITEFSTGMRAKLKVLLALSYKARLLILDEPTAGLDVVARETILDLLRSYMEQEGRGILISSHILSELADLCTSIGVINGGVMVQQGKLENIMLAIDSSNPLRITVLNQVPKALELLRQDPQVSRLSVDENKIAAWFSGSREEEAYLLQKLVDAGILVVSFAREHNSLESLFFHLTGETEQKSRNTETFGNTIG